MRRGRSLLCTLVTLTLALACGREAPSPDPVILSLAGQSIHRHEFEAYLAVVQARSSEPLAPDVREALFESFLEERLLVLAARQQGLLSARASSEDEQKAVRRLLQEAVLSHLRVEDEEIARYYEEHGAEFGIPETVTLRQILVATENEARDVRRRIQKDPRAFEILARTRSRGPEASTGGLMGTFARGQLPPQLEAGAFALRPGTVSEAVATPLGYHVLRVEAREPARQPSLDQCRSRIRDLLLSQKSDRGVREFVRDLQSRAKVNHAAAQAGPPRP